MVAHGFLVVCVWFRMALAWFSFGLWFVFCIVSVCLSHVVRMFCVWFAYDCVCFSCGFPLLSHGFRVAFLCLLMVVAWFSDAFAWFSFLVIFAWFSIFPAWFSLGFRIVFVFWVSYGFRLVYVCCRNAIRVLSMSHYALARQGMVDQSSIKDSIKMKR